MKILTFIVAVLLSIFSTVVMSYISMAIPIGPWISPTLALIAITIFMIFYRNRSNMSQEIALATSAGSVGGILATALGFYFTALYFVDAQSFNALMARPVYFSFIVGALSFVAGMFAIWVANMFEYKFIVQDKLSFPIGELVQKTISAQKNVRKSAELAVGFLSNMVFCFLRDGLRNFSGIIPQSVTVFQKTAVSIFQIPAIRFDLWPMLWALGFVTGHVIAVPLVVGVISKIVLVQPIHLLAFAQMSWMEYIITFCSGMVLSTAIFGFIKTPKSLLKSANGLFAKSDKEHNQNGSLLQRAGVYETVILFFLFFGLLTYFNFSFLSQIYIFIFSFICTYQIAIIAGKIGLAPMGKFATFVMVPAMFIFPINYLQIILIASFVGICGGVASDVLFGRKIAYLSQIPISKMKRYQYLGLIVSSLCAGAIFWFLINHFGLGSDQLFAVRAQNRWMLINTLKNATSFNYYVLILGSIFGFILSQVKVSPLLVLGGLFMPVNITLGLVVGALGALLVEKKEEMYPFWSGVYAAGSIWMLIRAIF
ncbi:OPT/YSL family transporter [Candidatus Dependentiae bacterium]